MLITDEKLLTVSRDTTMVFIIAKVADVTLSKLFPSLRRLPKKKKKKISYPDDLPQYITYCFGILFPDICFKKNNNTDLDYASSSPRSLTLYPTHLVTHDQNYRYTIKGSSTTGNIFFLFEYLSILPGHCLYVCWGLENKMYLTPYQAMTHLYFLSHDHGCSKNLLWKHLRLVSTIDGGDECNVEHKSIFWQMVITWLRGAS